MLSGSKGYIFIHSFIEPYSFGLKKRGPSLFLFRRRQGDRPSGK